MSNRIINKDEDFKLFDMDVHKIFDVYSKMKEQIKGAKTEFEIILFLFNIVYQKKYMSIEQLLRVPIEDLSYYLLEDRIEELEYYFEDVSEIITHVDGKNQYYSYTVARVMNNGYSVELHYSKDNGAYIELGTKISHDCWDNEEIEADWFNPHLSDEYILLRLNCIYDENFSNKSLSDCKVEELETVNKVLNNYNINDIKLHITNDEILIAYNSYLYWEGKDFYDFLLDAVIGYDKKTDKYLLEKKEIDKLIMYKNSYEEVLNNKKNIEKEEELYEK